MNDRPSILIGWYEENGRRRRVEIEPKLSDKDGKLRLSIMGTSGMARKHGAFVLNRDGDPRAFDGGQIVDEVEAVTQFAPGWDAARRDRLVDIWRWHLNDVNAACEHQRALGWTYDTHKGQDCPVCGYRIGSEWRYEELPADVIGFMREVIES
jgi:hypothetical protein